MLYLHFFTLQAQTVLITKSWPWFEDPKSYLSVAIHKWGHQICVQTHDMAQQLVFSQAMPRTALGPKWIWGCLQYGRSHLLRTENISDVKKWTVQCHMPLQLGNVFFLHVYSCKKPEQVMCSSPGWNLRFLSGKWHWGRKWRWTADIFSRLPLRNNFKQTTLFHHLTSAE